MSSVAVLPRSQPVGVNSKVRLPLVKGAVVYLGAGDGRDLPEYPGAQRLILVEADPEQARELRRRARNDSRAVVIAAAVSSASGSSRLRRFRLRSLNSLRIPTGLLELYPGLRMHDEIEVETMTPRDLVSTYGLRPQQDNWLIIDTPGEESAIVQSLRDCGELSVFDRIDLYCGIAVHYEDANTADFVLRMLDEEGYDVDSCDDNNDRERPLWSLRRNLLRLQNRELSEQLSDAVLARDRLTQELTEALEELEQIKLVSERSQRRQAEEIESLVESHRAEVEGLCRERSEWCELALLREQKAAELVRTRDELMQRISGHEARMDELSRERDAMRAIHEAMSREAAALRAEIERLNAVERSLKAQTELRDARTNRLTQERDAALVQAADLAGQIEAIRAQAHGDVEALQAKLREASLTAERLRQELLEHEAGAAAVDADIRILRAEVEMRDRQISEQCAKLDEYAQSVSSRDGEIRNLRNDLSVAIRMQSLREADLRDLQASYAELLGEKKEKDDLLAELSQRLEIVARYLVRKQ